MKVLQKNKFILNFLLISNKNTSNSMFFIFICKNFDILKKLAIFVEISFYINKAITKKSDAYIVF
jgi:hypothetical protein